MAENTTIEKKYLDLTGLSEFWKRVKKYVDAGGTALTNLTNDLNDTKINGTAILGKNTQLHGGNLSINQGSTATIHSVISGISTNLTNMQVNTKSLYTSNGGGQSITLYADDIKMSSSDTAKISDKIDGITNVLTELDDMKVNNKSLYESNAGQSITLYASDIAMSSSDTTKISAKISDITNDLGNMQVNGKSLYKSSAGQSINLYASDIAMSATDTTKISAKIDALSSATHFKGVVTGTTPPTISGSNYVDGDIIIVMPTGKSSSVEYICYNGAWIELGDTTAELAAINAINDWIDGNTIASSDFNDNNDFPGLPSL